MPRLPSDKLEARREAVLDGARRAFAAWGYHACTVRRLEEEIGRSRGGIFHWFPDKWHLFLAVTERDQQRIVDALLAPDLDLFNLVGIMEIPYAQAYAEALGLIAHDEEKRREWEARSPGLFDQVYDLTIQQQQRGELRGDVPARLIITYLLVLLDGLTLRRSIGYELTPDDAATLRNLALDAVRPQPERL